MKNTLRITAFGILFVSVLAALSALFNGPFWYTNGYVANRDARYAAIDLEEPEQIDVLNVGNSLCGVSLTPLELYRDYGITSYNISRDLQSRPATYYAVKMALRKQKIKVLLWETDNLCLRQDGITTYTQELSEFNYYHFPVLRYHSFWKNWVNGKKRGEFYKGYQIRKMTVSPDPDKKTGGKDVENDTQNAWNEEREQKRIKKLLANIELNKQITLDREQLRAFKRINNLCKANNIKLVLYSAPSMKYYRSRARHDTLAKLAEQYGIDYVDANFDEMAIGIDWNKDSYDGGGHLNINGTRKMTKYMGEYLSTHCGLTDHRGDPAYAAWADMERYDRECEE